MSFHIIYDDGVDNLVLLEESNYTTRIPMSVNVGDKEFRDKEALMKAMKTSKEPARTACPSIGHYIDAIEAHRDDDIYIVTLSSALSGSYNAPSRRSGNILQSCQSSVRSISGLSKFVKARIHVRITHMIFGVFFNFSSRAILILRIKIALAFHRSIRYDYADGY